MPNYLDIPCVGGVNLLDHPRRIRDDELVRAKNLVPYEKGMLKKRPAWDMLDVRQILDGPYVPINAVAFPTYAWDYVAAYKGFATDISSDPMTASGIVAYKRGVHSASGACQAYLTTAYAPDAAPALIPFGNNVYCFPGYPHPSAGFIISAASTASTLEFAGTNNSFSPLVACVYRNRFVYANFGPGYESHICFADPFSQATIGNDVRASNGRSFRVGNADGDRIVALVEITQSDIGAPSESALLVLKEYSAYIITGEPNKTTDVGDMFTSMVVNRIAYDCGCSSPQTVARTPYGTLWAGHDDVWFFARGSLPVRIGSKIRPILQGSPAAGRYRWHAAYFNGFYRLALHTPGASDTTTDGSGVGEQWWLDLRDGPPQSHVDAKWWGPQIFNVPWYGAARAGTSCMFVDARPNKAPELLGLEFLFATDGLGTYFQTHAVMQYDIQTTRDANSLWDYSTGITAASAGRERAHDESDTDIAFELITKEYDFGARLVEKGFLGLRTDYWTAISDYLRAEVLVNGGASSDTSSALCEQTGFLLDVDSLDGRLARTFQEAVLYPSTRVCGKTFQFRLYDQAGYVVGAFQDEVVVLYNGTYYAVPITQGSYAALDELLDHVVVQMNATLGISCSHDAGTPYTRDTAVTLTFGSAVTLCFQSAGGSITAAQLRKSRALMSMFGYDTSANSASATGQSAASTVYYKRITDWEFGGFEVEYDQFNRGPA